MAKMKKGPCLPNIEAIISLGINPKTGLPYKLDCSGADAKGSMKKILRVIDEQDAINRYKWYNLPCDLSSQELERFLYYKGQLAFFYMKDLDEFYFASCFLDGMPDGYGRYTYIKPIPLCGTGENEKGNKALETLFSLKRFKCTYKVLPLEKLTLDDFENRCVLLTDYSKQWSSTVLPRQTLNEGIIDLEAECIPYMRTNLIASSGVKGMRVADADQQDDVFTANAQIQAGALTGNVNVPIVGTIEFQELASQGGAKPQDYLLAMQSLDNFRLSTHGITNGGLFEKKQHILESENNINNVTVDAILQDGLSIRQNFCNIVNSIWGTSIWCEPSETTTGDTNGDGVQYDINDGTNSGTDMGGASDESNVQD